MFLLHYQTRRLLCRAAFLLCCLLPTSGVVAWGISRKLPGHVDSYCHELSQRLGMPVKLTSVTTPRPGVFVLSGLEIEDPERSAVILRVPELTAGRTPAGLAVRAAEAEIDASQANLAGEMLESLLIQHATMPEVEVQWFVGKLAIRAAGKTHQVVGLDGDLRSLSEGTKAQCKFLFSSGAEKAPTQQPGSLMIFRDRQAQPAVTGFEIETGSVPLPCALSPWSNLNAFWGPKSEFRGYLWARQAAGGWEVEIQDGLLRGIELKRLIGEPFSQEITGPAKIQLDHARFQDGRLESVLGTVTAGPGTVDWELLASAASSLELAWGGAPRPAAADGMLLYDELRASFRIDRGGIMLKGLCQTQPSGALIANGSKALLGQPTSQPQPVLALMHALSGPSAESVPVARQTRWLLNVLPLGEPVALPSSGQPSPDPAAERFSRTGEPNQR